MKIEKKWIIIGAVALFFIIGGIGSAMKKKDEVQEPEQQEEIAIVSEEEAYNYCHDRAVLSNLRPDTIVAAYAPNLNRLFVDLGWYDKDGNSIYTLSWNGFDKESDRAIGFICDISGTDKDHLTIHSLKVGTIDLVGKYPYNIYDKDGNLLEE